MAENGFRLETIREQQLSGKGLQIDSVRYLLTASEQKFILEVISYPDSKARYFLKIEQYYGLSSYSFELDSWKYHLSHIEFRYYTNPETGGALTLKLQYPGSAP